MWFCHLVSHCIIAFIKLSPCSFSRLFRQMSTFLSKANNFTSINFGQSESRYSVKCGRNISLPDLAWFCKIKNIFGSFVETVTMSRRRHYSGSSDEEDGKSGIVLTYTMYTYNVYIVHFITIFLFSSRLEKNGKACASHSYRHTAMPRFSHHLMLCYTNASTFWLLYFKIKQN